MTQLNKETIKLLNRLYNLSSDENIFLVAAKRGIESTEEEIAKTNSEQQNQEIEKSNKESELQEFVNTKNALIDTFGALDDAMFRPLKAIDVDFQIGKLVAETRERAPKHIEDLETTIQGIGEKISGCITRKSELEEQLNNYNTDREKAERDRTGLISLLEQSLSSDPAERDALSTNYVKGVLSKFDHFTTSEINELAKIIMFPEDGLFDYDEKVKTGEIDFNQEEVAEEPEPVVEEEVSAEPVEESSIDIEDLERVISQGISEESHDSEEPEEEKEEEPKEEIKDIKDIYEHSEEPKEEPEEEETSEEEKEEEPEEEPVEEEKDDSIENFLKEIGINVERLSNLDNYEDIKKLLESTDRDVISEGYEILRSISAEEAAYSYANGHMYIADSELNSKVTILRANGISDHKIKELLESNKNILRSSYQELSDKIKSLKETGKAISDDTISLLSNDLVTYNKNVEILKDKGYEIEEKEQTNYFDVLHSSPYISTDTEILKDYLISIVRKNGKYALDVFYKDPRKLLLDIDDIIESNLEGIIDTNPEVLGKKTDGLLARIKYCIDKGLDIRDGQDGPYYPYVLDYYAFAEKEGYDAELPELVDRNSTNSSLKDLLENDFVELLTDTLNEYYGKLTEYETIRLSDENNSKLEKLIGIMENKFHAETVGKYTYKVGDVFISRNKLERNISVLLNKLEETEEPIEGIEDIILLTSALYNLRQDEESIRKMVSECLGQEK